jgi:hypothetical protein
MAVSSTQICIDAYSIVEDVKVTNGMIFILKMDAADSSETLVTIYQTTWHHIPKGSNTVIVVYVS